MKKKKGNTPKRKCMTRSSRLASGKIWLETNSGQNIVKRYSKWYGVDNLCAIVELRILGLAIREDNENQIKKSMADLAKSRNHRKDQGEKELHSGGEVFSEKYFAFITGYTSGGFPIGIKHEEMETMDSELNDSALHESIMN